MAIDFNCPHCHRPLKLSDHLAGKRVRCNKCDKIFDAPASSSQAPVELELELAPADEPVEFEPEPLADDAFDPPPVKRISRSRDRDDDRPHSRRDDFDDDDFDRPRRRRRSRDDDFDDDIALPRPPQNRWLAPTLIGSGVLVAVLVVVIVLVAGRTSSDATVAFDARGAYHDFGSIGAASSREVIDGKLCRGKSYSIDMTAGQFYTIRMNGQRMDAFLYLMDDTNRVLAADDDGGGNLNSLLNFRPQRSGRYRIYATSLSGADRGGFELTIQRGG